MTIGLVIFFPAKCDEPVYGAVVVLLWSSRDLSFKINIWSAGQPFTYLFSFIVSFIKTKPNLMTSTFHDGKQNLGSNDWINTLLPTGRTSFADLSCQFASPSDWNQLEAGAHSGLMVCDRCTCSRLFSRINATADSSLQTRTVSGYNQTNTSVWPLLSLLGSWWCPSPPCPTLRRSFVLPAGQIPHHCSTPWDPPGVCWQ